MICTTGYRCFTSLFYCDYDLWLIHVACPPRMMIRFLSVPPTLPTAICNQVKGSHPIVLNRDLTKMNQPGHEHLQPSAGRLTKNGRVSACSRAHVHRIRERPLHQLLTRFFVDDDKQAHSATPRTLNQGAGPRDRGARRLVAIFRPA